MLAPERSSRHIAADVQLRDPDQSLLGGGQRVEVEVLSAARPFVSAGSSHRTYSPPMLRSFVVPTPQDPHHYPIATTRVTHFELMLLYMN